MLARNAQQPLAVDLEFDASAPWQYAIDPTTLVFHNNPPSSKSLPSPVFDAGLPPFTVTATACTVDWAVAGDTFAAAPPVNPTCTGPPTNITLWPFGVSLIIFLQVSLCGMLIVISPPSKATKLRIGEFPTVKIAA